MRWLRWIVGIAVMVALMWVGYWAVAIHLLNRALSDCSNAILSEVMSPDELYIATAFERSCGATTPFVRIVSIRPAGKAFDSEDRDRYVFVIEGQPNTRLAWTAPQYLRVSYSGGGGRINRQVVNWYGISVSYE